VDEDRVYTFGVDGLLQCRGVLDGALIWSIETNPRFGVVQNFFGVGSTPIVHGNLLIVQIGGSDAASQRVPPGQLDLVEGNGSGIVAFDKFTGQVRYQLTDELASYSSPVPATIDGRAWCFVFARGGLVGFNPTDGKLDFQFPWRDKGLESVNASNPVVVGNQVFISETYGPGSALLKVRPGGYDVVWSDDPKSRNKSMQTHWNTSIHHDGYLYGSSGRHTNNAELRCVELATGKVMWSVPRTTRSSLLYVDEHLICLTEMGDLVLLKTNPEKPEVVAAVSPRLPADDEDAQEEEATEPIAGIGPPKLLRYPAWAAPILSHGLLYLRGKDRLVCMELIRPKQ
jgi:outer membrane protein assembly factor BamB